MTDKPAPVVAAHKALRLEPWAADDWAALLALYEAGRRAAALTDEGLDHLARQIIGTVQALGDGDDDGEAVLAAVRGLLSAIGDQVSLPDRIETKMVEQLGLTILGVWVPWECLEDLGEKHGLEGFEPGVNLPADVAQALIAAGLAHKSTRGSLFPNKAALDAFIGSVKFGDTT